MNEEPPRTLEGLKSRFLEKAAKDLVFRRKLLESPRQTIEQEWGYTIPANIEVRVMEENPSVRYLVLPAPLVESESSDLSDEELETVAGGQVGPGCTCNASYCHSH